MTDPLGQVLESIERAKRSPAYQDALESIGGEPLAGFENEPLTSSGHPATARNASATHGVRSERVTAAPWPLLGTNFSRASARLAVAQRAEAAAPSLYLNDTPPPITMSLVRGCARKPTCATPDVMS